MSGKLKLFLADESGATAIEYGLIAALIGVTLITSANRLATALNQRFNFMASAMSAASING